jgi:serine/threonine-protein kinase HipA
MARTRQHKPLLVFLDSHLVGQLLKEPSGAIYFQYDQKWVDSKQAIPVSLSLPLREDPHKGERVAAVFENLLPDSEKLRQKDCRKSRRQRNGRLQPFAKNRP